MPVLAHTQEVLAWIRYIYSIKVAKICSQLRKHQDLFALFVAFKAVVPDRDFDLRSRQHLQRVTENFFNCSIILFAFSVLHKIPSMINYQIKYLWLIKSQEHCHNLFFTKIFRCLSFCPSFVQVREAHEYLTDFLCYSLTISRMPSAFLVTC